MKIVLVGGGSGGPVAPLLAVCREIKKLRPKTDFLLVGTKTGPEKLMAKNAGVAFAFIPAGKWRRYFSLKNFAAPFLIFAGLLSALKILRQFRPACVFGTGSFVQVPVIWAAWLLKIPVVLHQQDITPSLANRLCEFCAKKISVCFEKSLTDFSSGSGIFYKKISEQKVIQTGNPFRQELKGVSRAKALRRLGLKAELPVLLALGGGTGSDFINGLIFNALPELIKITQVVHSVGGRNFKPPSLLNYHPSTFISDMSAAYAAADIVVSRAGLSTLTELSNLSKLSIIIPMPGTHQEYNARLLRELDAAVVRQQNEINAESLLRLLRRLLFDFETQTRLTQNISKIMPKNAGKKIAEIILEVLKK